MSLKHGRPCFFIPDKDHQMRSYSLLIAGRPKTTDHQLDVWAPYHGTLVGSTYLAGEAELELAIAAAEHCKAAMAAMPSYAKAEALLQIAQRLEDRAHELATLLAMECCKPMRYANGELARAIQTFRIAAEECKRFPSEMLQLDWTAAGTGKEGLVKYFPIGVVSGISPFNFPLNLVAHKIAPAIAAGCPIVLKPASSTPLSAMELAHIISQTDLPAGAVSILPMGRELGNRLVTDERFKLLTFTGSPEVGWAMKAKAGKKRVVLELGGNAGVIISESVDMQAAMPRCVMGAFAYSGQQCIHAQRFFVHRSQFDLFCKEMKAAAEALVIGDPTDVRTDISAMIDVQNTQRVDQWVQEAVQAGATLLAGGTITEGVYMPTILTDVTNEMRVCSEEVFGPVITVQPFDGFEAAIAMLNDSRFGLQAGVFTDSVREMDMAFDKIECGGIIINDVPTFRVDHMPYGGVKDSGFGREGVKYAMLDMLEPRILVK